MNSIEIRNTTKRYDAFTLNNINLNIPCGSIVGLIGENGAGKTTLIKCILEIVKKDSGDIKIFNENTKENNRLIKEEIGVVLDGSFFLEILKVKEINTIMKNIYNLWDSELFFCYMNEFKIPVDAKISSLSTGMRKKLEIATALAHHPKLLILDEPTSGLDPVVRNEILDIFLDFIQDENHSILLSTHITSDLEHIADYLVFIDQGEIVFNKTRDEVLEEYGILKCDEDTFHSLKKEDIVKYRKIRYSYEVLIEDKLKMKRLYKDCIIDNITIEDLMVLYIKGEKEC